MTGFAVVIKDRGVDRCIAVFSQKFRARSFVRHMKQVDPFQDPRMLEIDLTSELDILMRNEK